MDSENPPGEHVYPIPIVVYLGRRGRKRIDELRRGEGPLAWELADVIEQMKAELAGEELAGKILVPLVVICRMKKRKPRKAAVLRLPFNAS